MNMNVSQRPLAEQQAASQQDLDNAVPNNLAAIASVETGPFYSVARRALLAENWSCAQRSEHERRIGFDHPTCEWRSLSAISKVSTFATVVQEIG
jgi:hypothetical protein